MSLSGEILTSRYRGRPIGHAFSSAIGRRSPIPAITPKADSRSLQAGIAFPASVSRDFGAKRLEARRKVGHGRGLRAGKCSFSLLEPLIPRKNALQRRCAR
jgi:hypothetical protein